MSAWIVSRNHIHYLVYALGKYELLEQSPHETGQMLWDENIASVSYRYDGEPLEDLPGPIDEDYRYEAVEYNNLMAQLEQEGYLFEPVQVVKAAACYTYQSCEHPAWEQSDAYRLITRLGELADGGNKLHATPAWHDAAWGID